MERQSSGLDSLDSASPLSEPLMKTLDSIDPHPSPGSTYDGTDPALHDAAMMAARDYKHAKKSPHKKTSRATSPTPTRSSTTTGDNRVSYPDPNNIDSRSSSEIPQFYDSDAILQIKPQIAHGYIVLLSCSDVDFQMSLAALTDGNVVDACFGKGPSAVTSNPNASMQAAAAKAYIKNILPVDMKPLAVECYTRAFKIVEVYHASMEEAGVFLCCKEGEIRKVAEFELRRVFRSIGTGSGVPPPPFSESN